MYNAQEVDATSAPQFYSHDRRARAARRLPMPRVYVIEEAAPNAFATGRNPSTPRSPATTGIMHGAERQRAARRDGARAGARAAPRHPDHRRSARPWPARSRCSPTSRCSSAAATAKAVPANPIAGLAGGAARAARREPDPDGDQPGARVRGRPRRRRDLGRPAARSPRRSQKIHAYARGTPLIAAERNPATAQMMIMNPLHGGGTARRCFSTHPSTEERVARLPGDGAMPLIGRAAGSAPARPGQRAQPRAPAAEIAGELRRPPCALRPRLRSRPFVAVLLAGCDMLGIESAEKIAAAREADGKAIGCGLPPRRPGDRGLLTRSTRRPTAPPSSPAGAT